MDVMKTKWIWTLLLALPLTMSLAGCGGKSESEEEEGVKVSLPTAEKPIDQSYITDDFVAAIVVHPSRVLNSSFVKELIELADSTMMRGQIKGFFEEAEEKSGFDIRKIEQVIVLIDEKGVENPDGFSGKSNRFGKAEPENMPGLILRYSDPIDEKDLIAKINAQRSEKKESTLVKKSFEGKSYYTDGNFAISVADEKTIVGGKEETLKKMLTTGKASSPLAKRLATLGAEHDVIFVIVGDKFEEKMAGFGGEKAPDELKEYTSYFKKTKSVAIAISVSSSPLVTVVLGMSDEKSASGLGELLKTKAVVELKEKYQESKENALPPQLDAKDAIKIVDELVDGITVGSKGTDVIFSIKRPYSLDDLPKMVKKAMMGGM
jgi:hypothetical protein